MFSDFEYFTADCYYHLFITPKGYYMIQKGYVGYILSPSHRISEEEYLEHYNVYKGY